MSRRTTLQTTLTAALAASVLAASPALAKPVELPAYPQPEPPKAFTLEDGRSADTRDAAKDAAIQPGQPTWPVNPKVLTPPAERSTGGGSSSNDDGIWLVVGIGLAGAALAGGAGAARYARVRARRVAV